MERNRSGPSAVRLDRRLQPSLGPGQPGDDEIEELQCVILAHDRAVFIIAELGFAISVFEAAFPPNGQQ